MAMLLDANVFIEAKNRYYGFDFCPGFWRWIERAAEADVAWSLSRVEDELVGRDDPLAAWVRERRDVLFKPLGNQILPAIAELSAWTQGQSYRPAAVQTFFESADFYLIAYAKTHGHNVVTLETPSDGVKRVKIPEPCLAMGVRFLTPFQMLRECGVRLDLGNPEDLPGQLSLL